ncbi:HisA/HisF-related TIM barrel protein [Xanthobacter sp. TB0139]|uniref:HisA/HisF-related TIM barrel protein n=1 Tax=Xanthobacter sp. TB0139 TaxID=3459178 RepID=UPI0040390C66
MDIIPVIDLLNGAVVRAVRGERSNYAPMVSGLCSGHDPVVMARALLDASRDVHLPHAGQTTGGKQKLYVADLDSILGRPAQLETLRRMVQALPDISFWLDAGFTDRAMADELLQAVEGDITPVFGSETLASPSALRRAFTAPGILSLDRRGEQVLDTAGCWAMPAHWPDRVIAMTLERVGAHQGPDLEVIAALRAAAPQARIIGAGGVRHVADLLAASAAGAAAWLVASALHDGRLERGRTG